MTDMCLSSCAFHVGGVRHLGHFQRENPIYIKVPKFRSSMISCHCGQPSREAGRPQLVKRALRERCSERAVGETRPSVGTEDSNSRIIEILKSKMFKNFQTKNLRFKNLRFKWRKSQNFKSRNIPELCARQARATWRALVVPTARRTGLHAAHMTCKEE